MERSADPATGKSSTLTFICEDGSWPTVGSPFTIFVDGVAKERISANTTASLQISSGMHTVYVAARGMLYFFGPRCNPFTIDTSGGDDCTVRMVLKLNFFVAPLLMYVVGKAFTDLSRPFLRKVLAPSGGLSITYEVVFSISYVIITLFIINILVFRNSFVIKAVEYANSSSKVTR